MRRLRARSWSLVQELAREALSASMSTSASVSHMSTEVVPVRRIREESIVTGEAVELEVRPASPLLRVAAGLTDGACTILAYVVCLLLASRVVDSPSSSTVRVLLIGSLVLATVVLPMGIEVITRGRSVGKWAWGLQVVRDDGGVITARHSLVRALAGILEIWLTFGSVATISAMVTPRSKRLGDLAAGTMVVRLPEPSPAPPLLMPPDLAVWASSAQVLPLPAGLQAEALGFLRGTAQMLPEVRTRAAITLATKVAERVAPAPPVGTDPERFLAAVLVVLRDREYQRTIARDAIAEDRRRAADQPPFGI